MKQTVNKYDFHRAFETMRPDSFSYEAVDALFEHFEEYEESTGEEMELDVIAICCDFTESSLDEFNGDYSQEFETLEEAGEYVNENGMLVAVLDDSIVYAYL